MTTGRGGADDGLDDGEWGARPYEAEPCSPRRGRVRLVARDPVLHPARGDLAGRRADLGRPRPRQGADRGRASARSACPTRCSRSRWACSATRLGVRRVLTQIVLLWSLFTALTGAAWNVTSLWVIRFLFGAGEAGCFPNLTRMLSQLAAARRARPRAGADVGVHALGRRRRRRRLRCSAINAVRLALGFVRSACSASSGCCAFLLLVQGRSRRAQRVNAAELELLREVQRTWSAHHQRALDPHPGAAADDRAGASVFLLLLRLVLLRHLAAHLSARGARPERGSTAGYCRSCRCCSAAFGSLASGMLPLRISRRWSRSSRSARSRSCCSSCPMPRPSASRSRSWPRSVSPAT